MKVLIDVDIVPTEQFTKDLETKILCLNDKVISDLSNGITEVLKDHNFTEQDCQKVEVLFNTIKPGDVVTLRHKTSWIATVGKVEKDLAFCYYQTSIFNRKYVDGKVEKQEVPHTGVIREEILPITALRRILNKELKDD